MSNHCLNCGAHLTTHQKFCATCGQNANTHRFTFRDLFHDFLHNFLHAEKGLLKLLKGLTLRPGKTAAEFIEGRRKTYFNPFAFLGLCIAVMVFMNSWIKPYDPPVEPDPRVMARMSDEKTKDLYILSMKRIAGIQDYSNKNLNILSIVVTPYFAFCLWLFFRRRNRNMAEIAVAYILFTAFSNLLVTLLISPWLGGLRQTPVYYVVFWSGIFLQNMYFVWGFKGFFNYRSAGSFIKILTVLCLAGVVGFILLIGTLFLYVYHGETFEVLKYFG